MRPTKLSAPETQLVAAVADGSKLVLHKRLPEAQRTIRAEVVRDLLDGKSDAGAEPKAILIEGAVVTSTLDLDYLQTSTRLEITGSELRGGMTARFANFASLCLDGSRLGPSPKIALSLEGVHVAGSVSLQNGFCAQGAAGGGAVVLRDATIGGNLLIGEAFLRGKNGPALAGQALQLAGDLRIERGTVAIGHGEHGAVRFTRARLAGRFVVSGSRIVNLTGPALHADRLAAADVYLNQGFEAYGYGPQGTVRLQGSTIGGELDLANCLIISPAGPAMVLDRVTVASNVTIDERTSLQTQDHNEPWVTLTGAKIGNTLRFQPRTGPIALPDWIELKDVHHPSPTGSQPPLIVDLFGTAVSGRIRTSTPPQGPWRVDGLTYVDYPTNKPKDWLKLLKQSPSYAAQPYQQLANVAKLRGDDGIQRLSLIAQRDDQKSIRRWRRQTRWPVWVFRASSGTLLKAFLGYGWRPWLALIWLAATTALAAILALKMGPETFVHTRLSPTPGTPCGRTETALMAVESTIPLVRTGVGDQCGPNTTNSLGVWAADAKYLFQTIGWVWASLFVAGFTNVVRKL